MSKRRHEPSTPVVRLEGKIIKDEDWEAIRQLAAQRTVEVAQTARNRPSRRPPQRRSSPFQELFLSFGESVRLMAFRQSMALRRLLASSGAETSSDTAASSTATAKQPPHPAQVDEAPVPRPVRDPMAFPRSFAFLHPLLLRKLLAYPGLLEIAQRLQLVRWRAALGGAAAIFVVVLAGQILWSSWDLIGYAVSEGTVDGTLGAVADAFDSLGETIDGAVDSTVGAVVGRLGAVGGPPDAEAGPVDVAGTQPSLPSVATMRPAGSTTAYTSTIQVGAFRDRANADRIVATLKAKDDRVTMRQLTNGLYLVTMGPYSEAGKADGIAQEIEAEMQISTLVFHSQE